MKRLSLLLFLMIPLISCSNKKAPTCEIMHINPYTSPYINWEEGDSILTSDLKSISDCFWAVKLSETIRINSDSSEITFNGIRYLRVPQNKMMYSSDQLKYVTQATIEIQYRGWCKELCIEPTFEGFIAWKNKYNKY